MYAIEFQAQIHNGVIEIPAEQREALLAKINGGSVHVIVLAPSNTSAWRRVIVWPAIP